MKVVKTQVILFMYDELLSGKTLEPKKVKDMFELKDKTFYRYVQEINAYFCNTYKNKKICYDRKNKNYYLI